MKLTQSNLLLLSFLFVILDCTIVEGIFDEDEVTTVLADGRCISGVVKDGVGIFHDVEFGMDTSGERRFRPPFPYQPSQSDLKECVPHKKAEVRHICPQFSILKKLHLGSEDCLRLHIYTPVVKKEGGGWTVASNNTFPAMVWVYGGGFTFGDGYEFGLYDGQNLARKHGVTVFALNYRVGALGYLPHSFYRDVAGPNATVGNLGLLDQRLGMQWVKANAGAFGSTSNQITLFGQSAGAMSVCAHIVSPASSHLFHSAIIESGVCDSLNFFPPLPESLEYGNILVSALGCSSGSGGEVLACLQQIEVEKVLNVVGTIDTQSSSPLPPLFPVMPFGIVVDGVEEGLPDVPFAMIKEGKVNPSLSRVVMGTNKDEGTILMRQFPSLLNVSYPISTSDLERGITWMFNTSVQQSAFDLYPSSQYASADDRGSAILTDFFFTCDGHRSAGALAHVVTPASVMNAKRRREERRDAVDGVGKERCKQGRSGSVVCDGEEVGDEIEVYLYHFEFDNSNWIDGKLLGDYHMSELYFVFDNAWPILLHTFDQKDKEMAALMGSLWASVAHNLDMDLSSTIKWPSVSSQDGQLAHLKIPPSIGSMDEQEKVCNFWQDVTFHWHTLPQ